jgi:hypothetical protein
VCCVFVWRGGGWVTVGKAWVGVGGGLVCRGKVALGAPSLVVEPALVLPCEANTEGIHAVHRLFVQAVRSASGRSGLLRACARALGYSQSLLAHSAARQGTWCLKRLCGSG